MLIIEELAGGAVSQDDAASKDGSTGERKRQRPVESEQRQTTFRMILQSSRRVSYNKDFKAIGMDWSTTEVTRLTNLQVQWAITITRTWLTLVASTRLLKQ